jgi:hypothetical protein
VFGEKAAACLSFKIANTNVHKLTCAQTHK